METPTFEIKPTKLDYYSREMEDGQFRFSPSSISIFLTNPKSWYDTHILGQSDFRGNTSTVLGTCVHYIAEQYVTNGCVKESDYEEIEQYIQNQLFNADVDLNAVRAEYKEMGKVLIDWLRANPADAVEEYISYEPYPGFFVEGSADARYNDIVRDYKTCKTKPSKMNKAHKFQAMLYAYIYNMNGIEINKVQIVYVQRKTKTIPPRVWEFIEEITEEEKQLIEKIIYQVYKGLKLVEEDEELVDIIFRANPLALY